MLRFIDSFDYYDTSAITSKYNSLEPTVSAPVTIQLSEGRNGTQAIRGETFSYGFSKVIDSQATWILGFALRVLAQPLIASAIVAIRDAGNVQCDLRLNPDGTLSVTRNGTGLTSGTSSFAINVNEWYYIEWKVTIANSIAANSCKVRINGIDRINVATGQDTRSSGATANSFKFFNSGTSSAYWFLDDLYICDDSGSVNNDFLGNMMVNALLPDGAGNSAQWTPSTGSNYQNVDDTTVDDDTSYNSSSTAGHIDLYTMENLPSSPASIKGIQWNAMLRSTDASAYVLHSMLRRSSTNYEGSTTHAPSSSYVNYHEIAETDPSTAALWTEAGVNALEAGIKLVSVT